MEGNSSGRDEIYSHIWMAYKNADIYNQIFGYGAQGSFIQTGKFAHSDWMELLINHGLIGIAVYLYYWKQFYKTWRTTQNVEIKNMLGLLLLVFFFKSIFSMSYASLTFYTNALVAYCIVNTQNPDGELS